MPGPRTAPRPGGCLYHLHTGVGDIGNSCTVETVYRQPCFAQDRHSCNGFWHHDSICAMAEVVRGWNLTVRTKVQSQAGPYEIMAVVQVSLHFDFTTSLSFCHCSLLIHPLLILYNLSNWSCHQITHTFLLWRHNLPNRHTSVNSIFSVHYDNSSSWFFMFIFPIQYTDNLTDLFRDYTNPDGTPVEFRILEPSLSVLNLPVPIEAQFVRFRIQVCFHW